MGKVPPRSHHIDRRAARIVAAADDSADNHDDLLTTEAAADWLGVSKQFLEIARSKNYGPRFVRVGPRTIMYSRGDVLAWLKTRTFSSTAEYQRRQAARR
jgi:predicted DNA-binding transcriptional regulator AlpA